MKKACALAGALILVGLVGGVLGDETIIPVIPFTNSIAEAVVEAITENINTDPRYWSLLSSAANAYRKAVYESVKSELPPGSEYDTIDDKRVEELKAVRERVLVGPMLLLPFWRDRFVLEIESRGIGKALVPKLEEELRYLRGETTPKLWALQKREELRRVAYGMGKAVTAKGGTEEEARDKEGKAWQAVSAHVEASGLGDGEIESFEWVQRRKKEIGGKVILAVLAHGVGKILNQLKELEAERAKLPKITPDQPAALAEKQPSAVVGRSPFRR